jgi:hypothetical protein
MNEETYRVEWFPKDPEPPQRAAAWVVDQRGVRRRASDAEAWLWEQLQAAREALEQERAEQAEESRRGRKR